MAEDFSLGGVIIPGNSDFAFNYVGGAQWNRFNDWSHLGSLPQGEWVSLPQGERYTITNRLRWLMRNNEYCAALHTAFQTHIGNSTLRSKARDNPAANDAKERFWLTFAKTCEVSGLSLEQVEEIILTELLCAGEVFALKLATGKVQLIPAEYVFSKADDGEGWIQGIQYSNTGVPISYRIGSRDHNGQLIAGENPVPAAQVMHIYRRERVEQLRGVPWLAAAVKTLRDIDEITSAKVASVKNQSFLSFAIINDGGASAFPNLAETGNTTGSTKTTGRPNKNIKLQNGTVLYLEKNQDVRALSTQFQSADFESFLISRLRAVGATIGLPLELFLEGYKDSNYSSARATNLAWARKVRKIRFLIELLFLGPLHLWASERERARPGSVLKGDRTLDQEVHWGWPAVPSIDEAKESEANAKKLAAGLTTYTDVYAEQNQFFDDQIKVRARDMRLIIEAAKAEGIDPQLLAPDLDFGGNKPEPSQAAPVVPMPPQPDKNTPTQEAA